jgi:AcrR family transcriptional regulator
MAPLREEHVAATRQALVSAARARFARLGFAGTSLDDVVADAGLTKGALYHHFKNKEHLFLAVYDELEGELAAHGMAAAAPGRPTTAVALLQQAFGAFLDRALDPEIQRIALLDAPAVLGVEAKLEVDRRYSLAAVRTTVELGIASGELAEHDAEVVAQLLIAACSQAALLIATDPNPKRARKAAGQALDRVIAGFAAAN